MSVFLLLCGTESVCSVSKTDFPANVLLLKSEFYCKVLNIKVFVLKTK